MQDAKNRQNSPSGHHRTTLSGYIFATEVRIDNRKKTCLTAVGLPHVTTIMVNFGPLTAEIFWRVCGTSANFNGFLVLALLLQRRRSTEANQTLHDLCRLDWYTCPSLAFSYIGSVTARHFISGRQPNLAALNRGRHLYSAGRP